MAILNNEGLSISYECSDLIKEVRSDMAEFSPSRKIYACCVLKNGVKIIFDYIYDIYDEEEMRFYKQEFDDEWYEKINFRELLAYLIKQNSICDYYDSINELFEATGWSIKKFSDYFHIPERTVQDWIYKKRSCPSYLIELINYKLIKENFI